METYELHYIIEVAIQQGNNKICATNHKIINLKMLYMRQIIFFISIADVATYNNIKYHTIMQYLLGKIDGA